MIPTKSKGFILGLALMIMLLVGVGNIPVQAQHRHGGFRRPGPVVVYGYRPYWGPRWGWYDPFWSPTVTVVNPIAQQRESGYSDGRKRGKDDAEDGKPNAPSSHKHYRNSNSQTYRQAFLQGYSEGYRDKLSDVREKYGR